MFMAGAFERMPLFLFSGKKGNFLLYLILPMYRCITILIVSMVWLAFAQVPTAGLQAYYPFNGNVLDSTGRTLNDGKLFITNSPVFTTDRTGNGYTCNFDGSDDYILIPNKSSFNLPRDSATIFAWYNASACGKSITGPRSIWDTWERSNTGKRRELSLYITRMIDSMGNPFQLLEAIAITSNNTDTELLVLPFAIYSDGWHSTGVVWEKPGLRFYVDGIQVGTITATIPDAKMSTNNKTTLIGSDVFTAKKCFCGLIDDIRLYNRGLSDSEIMLLAKEGSDRVVFVPARAQTSPYTIIIQNPAQRFYAPVILACPAFAWPPSAIGIFTADGRRVANLFWEMKDARTMECSWDGTASGGAGVFGGMYIVKVASANGSIMAAPITLLR
jgi:hypothetical protein